MFLEHSDWSSFITPALATQESQAAMAHRDEGMGAPGGFFPPCWVDARLPHSRTPVATPRRMPSPLRRPRPRGRARLLRIQRARRSARSRLPPIRVIRSPEIPVHFPPVAGPDHQDHEAVILDAVDDAVVLGADAIGVFRCLELLRVRGAGVRWPGPGCGRPPA